MRNGEIRPCQIKRLYLVRDNLVFGAIYIIEPLMCTVNLYGV